MDEPGGQLQQQLRIPSTIITTLGHFETVPIAAHVSDVIILSNNDSGLADWGLYWASP